MWRSCSTSVDVDNEETHNLLKERPLIVLHLCLVASLACSLVPTLAGPVAFKIPAGTKSGRTLRIKGKGAAAAGGSGDLLVTVEVAVPNEPSTAEREAIEALRSAQATVNPRAHLGV